MKKRFIFSCGDINGIGPEIVIKTLKRLAGRKGYQFIFICPGNIFKDTASRIKPGFKYKVIKRIEESDQPGIVLFDIGTFKSSTGKPTKTSGKASYISLETAGDLLIRNYADALITAPISKEALNAAGFRYPGHTEMLAEWFGTINFVMMFLSKNIKTALATIHKPISAVPRLITNSGLKSATEVILASLKNDFGIKSPRIGILGLNPHAGESGLIGNEEEKIIIPFVKSYRHGKNLFGPFSPDAYWGSRAYRNYDLTLGMYHDQVLIPFKLLNFSSGVNYTAGLPIVRTSPDHGVAYDIAGKNKADEGSLMKAFYFADQILKNRRR